MIHKEGFKTLIYSLTLSVILGSFVYFLFPKFLIPYIVVFGGLYLFLISFFRNPKRLISEVTNDLIYAPADGKIVVIEETEEGEYLKDQRKMVSIFMSPLNVHVNRNPVSGKVIFSKYHEGKYLPAWDPKASLENERTSVVYEFGKYRLMMRQIAGALAKRIVCYLKEGDQVVQGEDMGFIKLGSRVDLYLPLDAEIMVSLEQKVKGNKTVIAKLPQ
jgi:phosphatidylserine decarboxylase